MKLLRPLICIASAVVALAVFGPMIKARENHPGVLTAKPSDVSQKAWDYYTELIAAGDKSANDSNTRWVCFVNDSVGVITDTTFFLIKFSAFSFSIESNRDGIYVDDIPASAVVFFAKDPKGKSINTQNAGAYVYNQDLVSSEHPVAIVKRFPFSFEMTKTYTTEGDAEATLHFEEEGHWTL